MDLFTILGLLIGAYIGYALRKYFKNKNEIKEV